MCYRRDNLSAVVSRWALELCRRGLVPGSATQAGEVNLLVPMGYHSCVFFPIFLTFIYMAYL